MLIRHSKEKYMKRKYEYPKMEIIEFDTKDVITTSGIGGEAGNPTDTLIDVNKNTNWSDFY